MNLLGFLRAILGARRVSGGGRKDRAFAPWGDPCEPRWSPSGSTVAAVAPGSTSSVEDAGPEFEYDGAAAPAPGADGDSGAFEGDFGASSGGAPTPAGDPEVVDEALDSEYPFLGEVDWE